MKGRKGRPVGMDAKYKFYIPDLRYMAPIGCFDDYYNEAVNYSTQKELLQKFKMADAHTGAAVI